MLVCIIVVIEPLLMVGIWNYYENRVHGCTIGSLPLHLFKIR